MAASIPESSSPRRSAANHLTSAAHGSSDAHDGTRPDLDRDVTCAPLPTRALHSREPTNPVPPHT
eukprot:3910742-Prymnesium_polylepis.1